jgi:hypothetical protein
MFPDLFAAIGTTYGSGDGSTTFNVPDYNTAERFAQGDVTAGTVKQAGLPNITGNINCFQPVSGAFSSIMPDGQYGDSSGSNHYDVLFDASKSNPIYGNSDTVQPDALTCRYIIKAFDGQTPDSALIDITQYAQELATKATRSLDNLTQAGQDSFLERDFTIIYPNGGSESSPANVTVNTRYVEDNPFPGYYIYSKVELYINNQWGTYEGMVFSGSSLGICSNQLDSDKIIIQTGGQNIMAGSSTDGNPFGISVQTVTAPCRVRVWKIGKIPTA